MRTDKILACCRIPLLIAQIGPEFLDVCGPGCEGIGRNKAKHLHLPIHAIPQLPGSAANSGTADLRANGLDTAETTEPETPELASHRGSGGRVSAGTHQIISS